MKKKILLLIVLGAAILYVPSVFAANIGACSSVFGSNVIIDEKIPNTIHTVITVIKVAVPVLLVIFGMLDLAKGIIASKEDEIKKGQSIFIKRLITAALIFFITTIVQLLISFVAGEDANIMNCANCFINGADSCKIEE